MLIASIWYVLVIVFLVQNALEGNFNSKQHEEYMYIYA